MENVHKEIPLRESDLKYSQKLIVCKLDRVEFENTFVWFNGITKITNF